MAGYVPLQWVAGEQASAEKFKQLTDNDNTIYQEMLKRPQGILARDYFAGPDLSIASGWVTFMTLSNVVVPAGRWIKVSFCGNYWVGASSGTLPQGAIQVIMNGSSILYSHLETAWGVYQAPAAAAVVLAPDAGIYTFTLQGAPTNSSYPLSIKGSSTIDSTPSPFLFQVEDVGGRS